MTRNGAAAAAIAKISQATKQAMADPKFIERLVESGFEPVLHSDPAAAQRYVDYEIKRLAPVIKAVGFKLD